MDIEYLRDPFEHAIIDNILSDEDCNELWNLANHIPEKSIDFTRGGEQSDNAYMWNNNAGHNATHEIIDGRLHYAITLASRMFDDYNDEFYTWSCALTETNRNQGNFLYPHNDDPQVLKERDPTGSYVPASIKAVLYIPHFRTQYPHYGTKLYNSGDRSGFIREIKFETARCFMFKTGPHSWHGTDFVKGMPERRFFYTCEYLPRVVVNNNIQAEAGIDESPTGTPNG